MVRMSAEFEIVITSVERIDEYCKTPHEVTTSDLWLQIIDGE